MKNCVRGNTLLRKDNGNQLKQQLSIINAIHSQDLLAVYENVSVDIRLSSAHKIPTEAEGDDLAV